MKPTPRMGHDPIEMRRVEDYAGMEKRGDFFWSIDHDGNRSIIIAIPQDSDLYDWGSVPWTISHPNHCGAQWGWDDNEDKPTLTPSLHAIGMWHGWVRDGCLVEV